MSTCRSCGARIIWCMTSRGKKMPVDAAPSDDGNVVYTTCPKTGEDRAYLTSEFLGGVPSGERLHKSHFATCPDAAKHRRQR